VSSRDHALGILIANSKIVESEGSRLRAGTRPGIRQATGRWHVERTNSWHNAFNRLQRREHVIDAFFDLADATITIRSLIRKA